MLQRGVFELDRGGTEAALALFRRAVSWDAGSAPLRHALAIALNLQGKTEEAVANSKPRAGLRPGRGDALQTRPGAERSPPGPAKPCPPSKRR